MKKIYVFSFSLFFILNTFAAVEKKSAFDFALEHLQKSKTVLNAQIKIFHALKAKYFLNRIGFSKTHEKREYKRKALNAIFHAIRFLKSKKGFSKAALELNKAIKNIKKIQENPNVFKQLMRLNNQLCKAKRTKKMHIKLRLLREAKAYCQSFTHTLHGKKRHLIRLIHSAYEIFRVSGSPQTGRGINEINKARALIKRLYATL